MHSELERVKDEYVEEILELTKDGISMKNVELVDVLTHTAKNLAKLMESDSYGTHRRMADETPNEYVRRSVKQYGERMK